MVDASKLIRYEVDYRADVADINHPDAQLIAAAPDYWDAAEQMTTDATELEGDDAGYVAVSKEAYDALMAAHAKSIPPAAGKVE